MISEHKKLYVIIITALAVLCSLIYLSGVGESNNMMLDKILHIFIGFVPVFLGILWIRSYGLKSHNGKTVLLFTITLFLWILGNFLWWFVYDEALVSFSDVLWLAGYPLLMFGLLYGIQKLGKDIIQKKRKIVISIVLILLFGIIYFIFFPPVWDPNISDIENAVTIGYVIADLFLIIPLILLITFVLGVESTLSWSLFGLAFIVTLINDIVYAASYDSYIYEGLIDLIGSMIYLLFALAFVYLKPEASSDNQSAVSNMRKSDKKVKLKK